MRLFTDTTSGRTKTTNLGDFVHRVAHVVGARTDRLPRATCEGTHTTTRDSERSGHELMNPEVTVFLTE